MSHGDPGDPGYQESIDTMWNDVNADLATIIALIATHPADEINIIMTALKEHFGG